MIPLPVITRRMSVPVRVGQHAVIGGGAPVLLQAMTDAPTRDVEKAAAQVMALAAAGAELVRLTVDTEEAAKALPHIRDRLRARGCEVPLAGCFHYNGHTLLHNHPACAEALDKYRINPGNVGFGAGKDSRFAAIIETALRYGKAVRIGVNWGSLDQALAQALMDENAASPSPASADAVTREALVRSALESARRAEQLGLGTDRIVLSCKVSRAPDLIAVTRALAARGSYALHLGLTEAGSGYEGAASSAAALSVLLSEGLGDTVRVSLTPKPGEPRTSEVIVGRSILQALGLRSFAPEVTACPGCGRTESALFRELAEHVKSHLDEALPRLRARYPGSEGLKVAVMGCIVNGPGESKHADIGISLPGTGEDPTAPVFEDGAKTATLRGPNLAADFITMVERYVERRWG